MAKNSVVKVEVVNGEEVIDCDATGNNVLVELRKLKEQLAAHLGVEEFRDEDEVRETAKDTITVNGAVKKELKRITAYILSGIMAPRGAGQGGAGRAPKVDNVELQKIWLDYVRLNPTMPKGITDYRIAVLFNEKYPSDNPVTPNNVAAYAKKGNWHELLVKPAETV